MDRKEFMALLGLGAGSIFLGSCLGGCSKESTSSSGASTSSNIDFTLDLNDTANAALQSNGGYVYKNGVIVARTTAGSYIAVQQFCTHESVTIYYDSKNQRFHCDRHGANFSESGSVLNGPAARALKTYSTQLNGTSLRVYS